MKATLGMPDEELQVGGDETTPRCRSLHPDRRHRARARAIFQERIRLFNTASREKEPFEPIAPPRVTFYSCGPTVRARGGPAGAAAARRSRALTRGARRLSPAREQVYDFAHIGNFRAFLTYDLLKRWLQYCGFDVDHVCNLTDVDDKIIARAARDGRTREAVASEFSKEFFADLDALNCRPARAYPKATDHMDGIVEIVSGLLKKGVAYERAGSTYFAVNKFPGYGRKVAQLDFDGMQARLAREAAPLPHARARARARARLPRPLPRIPPARARDPPHPTVDIAGRRGRRD